MILPTKRNKAGDPELHSLRMAELVERQLQVTTGPGEVGILVGFTSSWRSVPTGQDAVGRQLAPVRARLGFRKVSGPWLQVEAGGRWVWLRARDVARLRPQLPLVEALPQERPTGGPIYLATCPGCRSTTVAAGLQPGEWAGDSRVVVHSCGAKFMARAEARVLAQAQEAASSG